MCVKKRILDLTIISKRWLNDEFFVFDLTSVEKLPEMLPGQFVQVLVSNSHSTFLRRPLSIHERDYEKNSLSFLIQIVGNGTRALSKLKEGDTINTILPLGNAYTIPDNDGRYLLIGGGCGVAPLLFLAHTMNKKGIRPDIIIGGRSKEHVLRSADYKKYGNLHITTEDGSLGEKGFVIHHSLLWKENNHYDRIYTCGPEAMMKAVAKYASKKQTSCEVSLENLMACGIGACLVCVVKTREGNKRACIDGPVFNVDELTWQI